MSVLLFLLRLLQVVFEPESLPSVSVVPDAPASWAGDLLAVAVTEEDLTSSGEQQQQWRAQHTCTAAA
jgi:Tfp pilus tip-associated adhesin PilY1